MALSHILKQDWDVGRFWAILATKIPKSLNTLAQTPRDVESRIYEVIYNVGINTNRIDEAWAACQHLKDFYPNDPEIEKQWQFINSTRQIRDALKDYMSTVNYLQAIGERSKLKALLAAAPST